jgi:hypothetical protein
MKSKYNSTFTCLSIFFWVLLSLTQTSEAGNVTFYVNGLVGIDQASCGTHAAPCKTISYIVNNKAQTNNDSVINIAAGTYNESIIIDKKNISLLGAGKDLTFIVGNPNAATINASGPVFVKITDLSIKNGSHGVFGSSATIKVKNTTVTNNIVGITIESNSSLDFKAGIVTANSIKGFSIGLTSSAKIDNATITSNTTNGIYIEQSSSASITNSTLAKNNIGMLVVAGSSAMIKNSIIKENKDHGIDVSNHASLRLLGGNKIQYNGQNVSPVNAALGGIVLHQNSQLTIQRDLNATVMDQISLNYGNGIDIGNNSSLVMVDGIVGGSSLQDANKADGIFAKFNSVVEFYSAATITNNNGWGLRCFGGSMYSGIPRTVSGNVQGQINCPNQ